MTRVLRDVTPELHDYLIAHSSPPDEHQQDLIQETTALGGAATMQISPEQGALLTILTKLVGARSAVEIGTFTGYSAISIARGLADGGRLLCCDVSDEWTSVARRYWDRTGLTDRIDLKLAPALETLRALPQEPTIDLAFLDADKENYVAYWDELVPRVRSGGVIAVDNVMWSGEVADLLNASDTGLAIHAFNEHARADDRVELVMLPVADGLTIARRR